MPSPRPAAGPPPHPTARMTAANDARMTALAAPFPRPRRCAALLALLAGLAGCEPYGAGVEPVLTPRARPAPAAIPPVVARPTSEKSAQLRSYLNQIQQAQLSQGLLRQDGGGGGSLRDVDYRSCGVF